ncbi:hypothetical protein PWG14_15410, partial (plasmid) [Chromobacterium amazonense]|uniref:hypothetical protein n=1 Tax=Chromobacterium amazonense TaxID=1382803 RepID=UPI00237DD2EF
RPHPRSTGFLRKMQVSNNKPHKRLIFNAIDFKDFLAWRHECCKKRWQSQGRRPDNFQKPLQI